MHKLRYNLIGIVGQKRSGKDTLAKLIQDRHGGQILSFATPIKQMIAAGFGLPPESPYWEEEKETPIPWLGVSVRKLMQTLGTEWGRNTVKHDLWTMLLERSMVPNCVPVIISDARFMNEQHWIKQRGGVLIGVSRYGATADRHASEEVDFSLCSHVIQNKSTLADYETACLGVMNHVLETRNSIHTESP